MHAQSSFATPLEAELIDRPVKFGPEFKPPSKKAVRRSRQAKGSRMFTAAELRQMIAAAGVPLKAMLLLAINGGMGNNDIGLLPLAAIDLKGGWLDYPRPKTAIQRRVPLWPETVEALRAAIKHTPLAEG